jgi:hypothetical protein
MRAMSAGATALEDSLADHLDWVDSACDELLSMGCAVVVVKLGMHGLRARATSDAARLSAVAMGAASPEVCGQRRSKRSYSSNSSASNDSGDGPAGALSGWLAQRAVSPAFRCEVGFSQPVVDFSPYQLTNHLLPRYFRFGQVRGTVGAGDATVGGFLAGMLRGLSLAECCCMACAVGATSVEGTEAASAIPTWDALQERVQRGDCESTAQSLSCVSVISYDGCAVLSTPYLSAKLVHAGATYGADGSPLDTSAGNL